MAVFFKTHFYFCDANEMHRKIEENDKKNN